MAGSPHRSLSTAHYCPSVYLFLCLTYLKSTHVLAQSGDGGAAEGIQPGSLGAESDAQADAAASGPDTGSAHLSHGAVIAIAVVVSLVVVLGTTMAVLFFLAKKRQWKVREGIRRSARKVTNAVKAVATPLTPKKMTFSPIEKRLHDDQTEKKLKMANRELQSQRDLEKGLDIVGSVKAEGSTAKDHTGVPRAGLSSSSSRGSSTTTVTTLSSTVDLSGRDGRADHGTTGTTPSKSKSKPKPPNVRIPSPSLQADSPKTPMWKKVFGR